MNKSATCYWCGEQSTTTEHVPPKSFFPKGQRKNLITVPSCPKHNNHLSKIDERFKLYLSSAGGNKATETIVDKSFNALQRPESAGFKKDLAENMFNAMPEDQPTFVWKVRPKHFDIFSEKMLRGLYFLHYQRQIDGDILAWSEEFIDERVDYNVHEKVLKPILEDPLSGITAAVANPEVFSYRYTLLIQEVEEYIQFFYVKMTFYKAATIYALARIRK